MKAYSGKQDENRELIINIQEDDDGSSKRLSDIMEKMDAKKYQPTMQEVWFNGWKNHNGTVKKGIFQTSLSGPDKNRLQEVYRAVESGELAVGTDNMQKFTKAHALRLHKELVEKRKHSIIKNIVETMPDNYLLINNVPDFENFLQLLKQEEEFAIDTETTGLDYIKEDFVVGMSFTLPTFDKHYYIPVRHTEGLQLPADYVFSAVKPILEDANVRKILFNAKFDIHMLIREGLWLKNAYFDGYVAMKLLSDFEESYSLKNLSTKYGRFFGFEDRSIPYEELFGRGGFQDAQFITSDGRRGVAVYYTCKDTHLTYKFYKDFVMKQFDRLPKLKKLYFDIERPITEICVEMEQNGFFIDMKFAETYGKELGDQIKLLEEEMKVYFGDININSNAQLSEVIYDKLKLPDVTKKRSVDAKTLDKLSSQNEGIQVLLKYRELNKLLTTYIHPMPEKTHKGYLHGQFLQVQTATGRFASKGPNLQNLPADARKIVVASNDNTVIYGADYSQIEPRILAHFSEDESMIGAYISGRDLYVEMAMRVFKLEEKHCLDKAYDPTGSFQPRKRVKSLLLGIMYGMSIMGISGSLGCSQEEAKQVMADFFDAFPKIKAWMDRVLKEAEANEYVETLFGRKRRFKGFKQIAKRYHAACTAVISHVGHLPDFIWHDDYKKSIPYDVKREYWDMSKEYGFTERRIVNTIIQGSAADVMKLAMVATAELCRQYGYRMIATIHDEILFELPKNISREAIEKINAAMLSVVTLKTPMKVDGAFMVRWGEEVGESYWFDNSLSKLPNNIIDIMIKEKIEKDLAA